MAFDHLQTLRFTLEGATARLSLCRPDKLNAFTGQMHAELREVLDALQQGQGELAAARVLVLGAQGKGFCAGQDWPIRPWPSSPASRRPRWVRWSSATMARWCCA